MSISPVSSGNSQLYTQATHSSQQTAANKVGDKDDKQGSEQNQKAHGTTTAPSINTSGQTTGQLINTTA